MLKEILVFIAFVLTLDGVSGFVIRRHIIKWITSVAKKRKKKCSDNLRKTHA